MIYDSHTHLEPLNYETPEVFKSKIKELGITGGLLFSLPPKEYLGWKGTQVPHWKDRIAHVLDFCAKVGNYYAMLWLDPTEPDAVEQVEYAKNAGVTGLKILCSNYYPVEGMAVYRKAAELRMPIVFHSGILWDGLVSANFNRPANFECLLDVPDVRFALAHVSWPWTDENIALFGKFRHAKNYRSHGPDMYVDTSPGAADIFRDEIFRKYVLLRCGIEDKLMFAIDGWANNFNVAWAKYTIDFDREMFKRLQEKYGSYKGFVDPNGPLANAPDEVRNPFLKTWENATQRNMLNFIKPW